MHGAEPGKAEKTRGRSRGAKLGTFRVFPDGLDREVDLSIDKVELRDGVLLLSASGKAPCDLTIADDDVVEVIGGDGRPVCKSWIKVYSLIIASSGSRVSITFPIRLGSMVNMSMADYTLDVDL